MRLVVFRKPRPGLPYSSGEQAGFPQAEAFALVRDGFADFADRSGSTLAPDPPPEPKRKRRTRKKKVAEDAPS